MFKHLNRRISTPISMGIICALAIIVGGGVLTYQYFIVKNSEWINPPANQVDDWKTYTNSQYGFEFKYPKGWVTNEGVGPTVSVWSSEKKRQESINAIIPIYPEFSVNYKDIDSFKIFAKVLLGKDINSVKDFVSSNFYRFATTEIAGKTAYAGITVANRAVYSVYVEYNNGVYVLSTGNLDESFQDPNSPRLDKDIQGIISTFKFTDKAREEKNPVIETITPNRGPKGTVAEIRGSGLSGFEGDLDVYFERGDGEAIMLTDTFGSYAKTQDKLIKVIVVEPCQKGEKVYGRYSGIESECDYKELIPGVYDVFVKNMNGISNVVNFEIIDFPFTLNDEYSHAKQVLAENGWVHFISSDPNRITVDSNYPEIENCGSGVDAICSVEFRKNGYPMHLNLKSVYVDGKPQWIVVGNE